MEQLAAILRLAGGLDRSHSQQVKDVTLGPADSETSADGQPSHKHHGKQLALLVHADFNPEVDIWGARRRVKLFRKVFGVKLDVNWAKLDSLASEKESRPSTEPLTNSHNDTQQANGLASEGATRNGASKKSARKPRRIGRQS